MNKLPEVDASLLEDHTPSVVHYSQVLEVVQVGQGAVLIPLDHSSYRVRNGQPCYTSAVQHANTDSGLIRTLNTIYMPCEGIPKPFFTLA